MIKLFGKSWQGTVAKRIRSDEGYASQLIVRTPKVCPSVLLALTAFAVALGVAGEHPITPVSKEQIAKRNGTWVENNLGIIVPRKQALTLSSNTSRKGNENPRAGRTPQTDTLFDPLKRCPLSPGEREEMRANF